MSRNSWYSQQTTPYHPGVDIFLRENADDVLGLVNQLENPLRLLDKKGIRLRMRKEVTRDFNEMRLSRRVALQKKADTRLSHCGQTMGEAVSADKNALENNRTNFLICTIMVWFHVVFLVSFSVKCILRRFACSTVSATH